MVTECISFNKYGLESREGVIIDDGKTTHFNDVVTSFWCFLTSQIDVREKAEHSMDHEPMLVTILLKVTTILVKIMTLF